MEKRNVKTITLRFAKENKKTWQYIKRGIKNIETRANTAKYQSLQKGDFLILVCDGKKIIKEIKKITRFKTIKALITKYDPGRINPGVTTLTEMEAMYYSYPGYKEKIKEYGIVAFELH